MSSFLTCPKYFGHVIRAQNLSSQHSYTRGKNRRQEKQRSSKKTLVGRHQGLDGEATGAVYSYGHRQGSVENDGASVHGPQPSEMRRGLGKAIRSTEDRTCIIRVISFIIYLFIYFCYFFSWYYKDDRRMTSSARSSLQLEKMVEDRNSRRRCSTKVLPVSTVGNPQNHWPTSDIGPYIYESE